MHLMVFPCTCCDLGGDITVGRVASATQAHYSVVTRAAIHTCTRCYAMCAARMLANAAGATTQEHFAVVSVSGHDYVELFHGTVDGSLVHVRVLMECVVARAAVAVMLVHNHPSGHAEPSRADLGLTHRIQKALAMIDVKVVDHLIVGETITSMAERGAMSS